LKIPKGKGFDLAAGAAITVFLDDFAPLTGLFLGDIHKRRDSFHEFILLRLTRPFVQKGGTKISAGTLCAINVEQILFIIPAQKPHDHQCHDEQGDGGHGAGGCEIWEDECDDKHVINISCNRPDGKQRIININCCEDEFGGDKP